MDANTLRAEVGLVHRQRQHGVSRAVSVPNIFRALRTIVAAKAALGRVPR